MKSVSRLVILLMSVLVLQACTRSTAEQQAQTIYFGGVILTMNDAQKEVEAIAIKDGKILALGAKKALLEQHKGAKTELVDLKGRTLMPGFIDGHAHFLGFGSQAVGANLLAAPDGAVENIDALVEALAQFAQSEDVKRTGWVFGMGYDDAILGRHPTREDLDKVSTVLPVMAVHISGHFSAVNSKGLEKIGYTAQSEDPEGGVIRRMPGSNEPNGVLEELASIVHMIPAVSAQSEADKDYFLARGLQLAKQFGYTTVNEGRLMAFQHADLLSAAKRNLLDIDVMSYVDYSAVSLLEQYSQQYDNRYRVAGLKITLDGSPQGRTAWRTQPYKLPPEGQASDYRGYPALPETAKVEQLIDQAFKNAWPVHIHANGDAAIDQMLAALHPVQKKYPKADHRTTLIHGQFLRLDQIPRLKEYGVIASLFSMHTFYWGDWYGEIIGEESAHVISPMRSSIDAGVITTTHTDAPVALPNLMQVVWASVNRVSRTGKVIGGQERISAYEALKTITIDAAYQHFEDAQKGSLEEGKLADMVILSENPLTIDSMRLNQIAVLQTIKDGQVVYRKH